MPQKAGFDWDIKREEVMGFHHHLNEIEMRSPDIVVYHIPCYPGVFSALTIWHLRNLYLRAFMMNPETAVPVMYW
jgi:hypothetical protein